jgi:uncharacterized membrane protein YdjX (TVP38/TMEM64 family)
MIGFLGSILGTMAGFFLADWIRRIMARRELERMFALNELEVVKPKKERKKREPKLKAPAAVEMIPMGEK